MIVNGKPFETESSLTVADLLDKLNLNKNKVVVEVNFEIVSREVFSNYLIDKEDKVEIISFIGGG